MKRRLSLSLLVAGLLAGAGWATPVPAGPSVSVIGRHAVFDFTALVYGPQPSLASSLGGPAVSGNYRGFLAANLGLADFTATDLGAWPSGLPQGALDAIAALNPDGLVNVTAAGGQTWQLVASVGSPLPAGYSLYLKVTEPGPGGSSWYTPLAVGVPAVVASGSGSVWLGLQYHLVVSRADAAGAVAAPDLQVSFDVQAGS